MFPIKNKKLSKNIWWIQKYSISLQSKLEVMKPYTDQNKGNRDEDLRRNWRDNSKTNGKKKDRANKKSYRKRIKNVGKDEND